MKYLQLRSLIRKYWIEISLITICTYKAELFGFLGAISIIAVGYIIEHILSKGVHKV